LIELKIPGRGIIQLEHLVTDVNGTLAIDGQLIDGVRKALLNLQDRLQIHLLTADTHGRQAQIDQRLGMTAVRIQPGSESESKASYVKGLGADTVAAIGQGANDAGMLAAATIGICVLSAEGAALQSLNAADLVAPDILSALDLFERPLRIVASLRR
jgi:P-type E1-E2 ATPase